MLNKEDDHTLVPHSQRAENSDTPLLPPEAEQTATNGTPAARSAIAEQKTDILPRVQAAKQNGQHDQQHRRTALAAMIVACIGVFLTALDQTVVVTALPQIITDLNIPLTQLDHASWIISAYLLGFVVVMPLMGRVSDLYGRRRIFNLCLVIFGIGSVFCGLAPWLGQLFPLSFLSILDRIGLHIDLSSPGLTWLIVARLVQAIGGGALVPVAMAIAGDFYGQEKRGIALGIIGAVTEVGGVLGPVYGAVIVELWGWEYIFYLNVPLVILMMIGAWLWIPRGTRLHEGVDWIGSLLLGIALTCLSLGLAQQGASFGLPSTTGSASQNNLLALILSVVFLLAFILFERKARWPVVDLSLFKNISFSASSLASLLVGAALIIAMADIPIYMEAVLQRPIIDSSLALLRLTALIPVGALIGGWLCNQITCRWTAVIGILFTAIGFYFMSLWPINVGWTQITISTMTAGLGFGLVIAPISTTAINAVRAQQAGMSSAIVTALRMVGMMLGLAALTSWALSSFKQLIQNYPALPNEATAAQFILWSQNYAGHLVKSAHSVYNNVFFATMILCLIALIPAFFLWGNRLPVEIETRIDDRAVSLASVRTTPGSRKKLIAAFGSIALTAVLIIGLLIGFFANARDTMASTDGKTSSLVGSNKLQIGLDKEALTSVFTSQFDLQGSAMSDFQVAPEPNNTLILSMNVHIDANGIQRSIPVEMTGILSLDKQQELHLKLTQLKRDNQVAPAETLSSMQKAIDEMFSAAVMPALRTQFKGVKLVDVQTDIKLPCSQGAQMLTLVIETPAIEGIPLSDTPQNFCLNGPVDLNHQPSLPTP